MCGRYTLAGPDPSSLRDRFGIGESVQIRRRYNVAPGDDVLAVTTDREGAPRGQILRVFLVQGAVVGFLGAIVGSAAAHTAVSSTTSVEIGRIGE